MILVLLKLIKSRRMNSLVINFMENIPEIKAVLFDIGGVLNKNVFPQSCGEVAMLFEVSKEQATKAIFESLPDIQIGKHKEPGFWRDIADRLGKPLPEGTETLWYDLDAKYCDVNQELISIAKKIKSEGIKIGVLSNTEPQRGQFNRDKGLLDHFDPVILSYEVGLRKPEAGIFRHALDKLSLPARNVAFIDDHESNLESARNLGIHTHLYKSVDGLRDWLNEIGIEI